MVERTTAAAFLACALLLAGCSDSSAPTAPAAATPPTAAAPVSEVASAASGRPATPSNPIAAAAHEFLDAVFAGDTDRADRLLTPAAAKQLAATGQRFAPPGTGPTSFAIGEVRVLGPDRAAVECVVRGELNGSPAEESLGCLLRRVAGRWAVSGIAYEVSPGEPPTVFDFERLPPQADHFVASPPVGRPGVPPRTASQPAQNPTR